MKIVKHNLILHNIQEKIVMENAGNQLILLINHECRQMKRDNRKMKKVCFCSEQNICNNTFILKKSFFHSIEFYFFLYI